MLVTQPMQGHRALIPCRSRCGPQAGIASIAGITGMTGITRELVRDAGSQALPGGASPNLHLTRSRGTREYTALRSTAQARSSDPDSPSSHARRVPAARGRAEVCAEASQAHEPQLTPSTPRNTPPSFRATWGHPE